MKKKESLHKYISNKLTFLVDIKAISERELNYETQLILEYIQDLSKKKNHSKQENLKQIDKIVNRRLKREPIQYILEKAYFYDIELIVGKGVLIPRFDTELMVDIALNHIKKNNSKIKKIFNENQLQNKKIKILDLCAGSGAIGLSILNNTQNTELTFADISEKAIYYIKKNIKALKFKDRSIVLKSDMFSALKNKKFDLILCNPPYIPQPEYDELKEELRRYEPSLALLSEYDKFYKILAKEAANFLFPNGAVIVELNSNYSKEITNIFEKQFSSVKIYKDLNGLDRVFEIKL